MTWDSSGIDGPNINTLWEMDFLDESIGYITSTRGCIYKTTDGGASWALQNDTSRLAAVDVFDLDVLDELRTATQLVKTVGYLKLLPSIRGQKPLPFALRIIPKKTSGV